MANPIPFPLPERPDQFQIDQQWAENYIPAFKYGAKLDGSQIVGGNITIEDTGIPVGVFDTLDFVGATIVDNGDGSATITVTADVSSVDWSTANWTNFFTDIDWSQNTDWDTFVTSLITNWTATNWDNFIDTFITNVDSDDVFNFLNQIAGLTKGDILVYNGSSFVLLSAGADGLFLQASSGSPTGLTYAAGGGGSPLILQEEGVNVETATTTINFTGAGATATSGGAGVVNVAVPGGALDVQKNGSTVEAAATVMNFTGSFVNVTPGAPGEVNVNVLGGGSGGGLRFEKSYEFLRNINGIAIPNAAQDQEAYITTDDGSSQIFVDMPNSTFQDYDFSVDLAGSVARGYVILNGFLYLLLRKDPATSALELWQYDVTNISAGGTLVTFSGANPLTYTADAVQVSSDGTDIYFNYEAGNSASDLDISRYSVSGSTLTYVSTTTLAASPGEAEKFGMRTDGSYISAGPVGASTSMFFEFDNAGVQTKTYGPISMTNVVTSGILMWENRVYVVFPDGAGRTAYRLYTDSDTTDTGGLTVNATANEDMLLGTPVGYGVDGNIARANLSVTDVATNLPVELSGAGGSNGVTIISVVSVDTDKYAILFYNAVPVTNILSVVIATVDPSSNNVTYGSIYDVTGSAIPETTTVHGMCKLDTDKVVITFTRDGQNDGEVIVATIAGTVVSYGTKQTLAGSGNLVSSTCCQLDTDKFGFMYGTSTAGARFQGFATVSGTVVTVVDSDTGAYANLNNNDGPLESIKIATDKFVVYSGNGRGAAVCTTVGATFTIGSVVTVTTTSGVANQIGIESIATDTFWVRANSVASYNTVSGTIITVEDEVTGLTAIGKLTNDGTDVFNFNISSQTKLEFVGSAIVETPIMRVLLTGVGAQGFESASDGANYFVIARTNGSDPKYHLRGMSDNFIGSVTADVSTGGSVSVVVKGNATAPLAQTILSGVTYEVEDGAYTPTVVAPSTIDYSVVGVDATTILI